MKRIVLASHETPDGSRCVDIFQTPDGCFGFEEYRRDPEDPRGWSGAAGFGSLSYETEAKARAAALQVVIWLSNLPNTCSTN